MFGFNDIKEKPDKKDKIILAAEHLFAENGFGATSVRDIAKAAGINIAMISYYFGSKEKLMEALFTTRMEAGKASVKNIAADKTKTAMVKLEEIIAAYINRVFTNRDFYRLSVAEQIINKNKTILALYHKSKKEYADSIMKIVEEGYQNGEFKNRLDNVLLLNLFNGFIIQTSMNQQFYNIYNKVKDNDPAQQESYRHTATTFLIQVLKSTLGYDEK